MLNSQEPVNPTAVPVGFMTAHVFKLLEPVNPTAVPVGFMTAHVFKLLEPVNPAKSRKNHRPVRADPGPQARHV